MLLPELLGLVRGTVSMETPGNLAECPIPQSGGLEESGRLKVIRLPVLRCQLQLQSTKLLLANETDGLFHAVGGPRPSFDGHQGTC